MDYHNNSEDLDELCMKLGIVINKTNIANLKENLSRAGLPLLYEKKISRSSSYDDYQLIEAYKISTSIKELSNKLGLKFIQKNIKKLKSNLELLSLDFSNFKDKKLKTKYITVRGNKVYRAGLPAWLKTNFHITNSIIEEIQNSKFKDEWEKSKFDLRYLSRFICEESLTCEKTSKVMPFNRAIKQNKYLNDDISRYHQGHLRGKKRPEHSIKVSKALSGKSKTPSHRKKLEERLQSNSFKRKVLDNAGVRYTDINLEAKYGTYRSVIVKSISYRRSFVRNNSVKYFGHEIAVDEMSDEEVEISYTECVSRISTLAMKNNPQMGVGRKTNYSNIKYNSRGLSTISLRSNLEKKLVKFFEKNSIKWDYEITKVSYPYQKSTRIYIIDFSITINDEIFHIECKGSIRKSDENKNRCKLAATIKEYGKIILWQNEPIYSIEDLLNLTIKKEFEICFKHVYEDTK